MLAIDGGNSKTDVALVGCGRDGAGRRCAAPARRHEDYGIDGAMRRLGELVRAVAGKAGRRRRRALSPGTSSACLADADLPEEEAALTAALPRPGWSQTAVAVNDTFAVLRGGLGPARGAWR